MDGTVFNIKRYSIHDGPGIRTTVFLKGCPLNCIWCHNPEGIEPGPSFFFDSKRCMDCLSCIHSCGLGCISKNEGLIKIDLIRCTHCNECVKVCPTNALSKNGEKFNVDALMKIIQKDIPFFDESKGGVTFSGGEPMFQFEFLYEMLLKCKNSGINTVVDTSGYASQEKFDAIKDLVDLFLYDLKCANTDQHIQYTGVSNNVILENLGFLMSQTCPIWIRIPVIEGINDSEKNVSETIDLLKKFGFSGRLHLLAYHDLASVKVKKMVETKNKNKEKKNTKALKHLNIETIKEAFQSQGFEVKIGG